MVAAQEFQQGFKRRWCLRWILKDKRWGNLFHIYIYIYRERERERGREREREKNKDKKKAQNVGMARVKGM